VANKRVHIRNGRRYSLDHRYTEATNCVWLSYLFSDSDQIIYSSSS